VLQQKVNEVNDEVFLYVSNAVLPGPDILSTHCSFTNSSGEVILSPSHGAFITVNGHLTAAPVKLSQGVIDLSAVKLSAVYKLFVFSYRVTRKEL